MRTPTIPTTPPRAVGGDASRRRARERLRRRRRAEMGARDRIVAVDARGRAVRTRARARATTWGLSRADDGGRRTRAPNSAGS